MVEAGAEGEEGEDSEVAATSGVEEEDSGVDSGLLLTIIVEEGSGVSKSRYFGISIPIKYSNFSRFYKVNRCLARYSPRATTTNRLTNRAHN